MSFLEPDGHRICNSFLTYYVNASTQVHLNLIQLLFMVNVPLGS